MLTAPAMPRQLYQNVGMCLDAVITMPSEGWHVGWRNLGAARWKGSRLLDLSPSPRTYEGHCSPPDSPLLERSLNGDKLWQIVRDYGGRKKIHTFKGTFFITFCTSLSTNRLVNHAYYVGIIFIFTQTSGLLFNPEYSLLFPVGFYTASSEERFPPVALRNSLMSEGTPCSLLCIMKLLALQTWGGQVGGPPRPAAEDLNPEELFWGSGSPSPGPGSHFDCPLHGSSAQLSSEVGWPRCHYGTQLWQLPRCVL